MIRVWRVAVREYLENTKTKGFWIGIIMFPAMLLIFSQVPQFLEEKATPTRHFVVVDRSEEFGTFVTQAVDAQNRKKELEGLVKFMRKQRPEEAPPVDAKALFEQIDQQMEIMGASPLDTGGMSGGDLLKQDFGAMFPDEVYDDEKTFDFTKKALLAALPEGSPEFEPPRPRFVEVGLPEGVSLDMSDAEIEEKLRPYLTGDEDLVLGEDREELFALIIIPADIEESRRGLRYWSKTLTDTDLDSATRRHIAAEIRKREYTRRGVKPEVVAEVEAITVGSVALNPKKALGEEKVSIVDTIRQWAPSAFVYLLWISIVTTAQMLLNNMIEEKSNRVVEVLLSSVTPGELLRGKLFGIAMLGLTMISAWLLSLILILQWKAGPQAEWAVSAIKVVVTPEMLIPFIVYFVLGYLIYAAIFASIGSVCNTIKDSQNFMGPVMMVLMVPMVTMIFIPRDPNGTLATILSWIPLYTPFVMMNRVAGDPPMFDVIGTMVLLLVSVVIMLWASGRIFRVGMLRTGQPPKILELIRWVTKPA